MISLKWNAFYWLAAAISAVTYRLVQWLGETSGVSRYLLGSVFTTIAVFAARHATYEEHRSLATYYTILGAAVVSLGKVAHAVNETFAMDPEQHRLRQELSIHIPFGFLFIAQVEFMK